MRVAVYPGSFDPLTLGHEDVISEALKWVDQLWILVGANPAKTGWLSPEQRAQAIAYRYQEDARICVDVHAGALVDWMRSKEILCIIKGIRGTEDWDHEASMAWYNRQLGDGVSTVFVPGDPALHFVSSSAVRQLHRLGRDLSPWVSKQICECLPKVIP